MAPVSRYGRPRRNPVRADDIWMLSAHNVIRTDNSEKGGKSVLEAKLTTSGIFIGALALTSFLFTLQERSLSNKFIAVVWRSQ